ncbi:threonine--tRNA ligase [Saccharomycopsis crataegensis]|uniref:threonine--tRNA ligase n=1 Tax=Saccharomycopsis crataegensis TaxID=43959 RepID=A0AAV5QXB7_9ASCO|nr:threonine--tRNA ligase [Saccharomycopsis crataegensis]
MLSRKFLSPQLLKSCQKRLTPRFPSLSTTNVCWNSTVSVNKKKNVDDKTTISANASLSNKSISTKQQLYTLSPYSPGSIFFLPNGAKLFNKLINFIRIQEVKKLGFDEVMTPLMYKKELFEISNHWKYYNEDMFKIYRNAHEDGGCNEHEHEHEHQHHQKEENEVYALKPMNCPGHCLIYKQFPKTHNDLPVRYSDFSSLHRNEASGALSGLTRVRRFHQDDGHIFCSFQHLESEILANLKLVELIYEKFGLGDFKILLSTRPKNNKFIGKEEDWEKAEGILIDILEKVNKKWELNEGDGAFYGPKIDIILKDKFGKFHQTATIQLDFQLPNNFGLKYFNEKGEPETPIIVHRAIFGSVERFLAILIDNYEGKWPFWLNSNQIKVVPVSPEKHSWYCKYIEDYLSNNGKPDHTLQEYKAMAATDEVNVDNYYKESNSSLGKFKKLSPLTSYDFNIEVDDRAESLGKRIKDAYSKSFNYLVTIGDAECESALKGLESGEESDLVISLKGLHGKDKNKVEKLGLKHALEKFIELEKNYE